MLNFIFSLGLIKVIVGKTGSGKSITAVNEIVKRDCKCYTNFEIMFPKATRLKISHIIKDDVEISPRGKEIHKKRVNWAYWNSVKDKEGFDIYIDEAHNVLNSRSSMSLWNKNFTSWITQIRKLFGENEKHHLYLITQRLGALDVVARDLLSEIIYCNKVIEGKDVGIIKYVFKGAYAIEKFNAFENGLDNTYDSCSWFIANGLFKYYNSYALIDFGDDVYV